VALERTYSKFSLRFVCARVRACQAHTHILTSRSSSTASRRRRGSSIAAATAAACWQAADKLVHVLALHGAHEQLGPERGHLNARSLRTITHSPNSLAYHLDTAIPSRSICIRAALSSRTSSVRQQPSALDRANLGSPQVPRAPGQPWPPRQPPPVTRRPIHARFPSASVHTAYEQCSPLLVTLAALPGCAAAAVPLLPCACSLRGNGDGERTA